MDELRWDILDQTDGTRTQTQRDCAKSRRANLLQTAVLVDTALAEERRGGVWLRLTPPSGKSDAEMTETLTPG